MTQQNPNSEIVLSGEPTYGNGTYSQIASSAQPNDDMQRQVEEFVRENTYGDTEPAPHTRVGIITGGFASDEAPQTAPASRRYAASRPRQDRPDRRERETAQNAGINPNGTFFITEGSSQGGMKMNWETWRYHRVEEGAAISAVDVVFPSNRTVRLIGKDAYNFLKIVGDRNAEAFSRPARTE